MGECVAHLVEKDFWGTIIGTCGDRVVVAVGPFVVEIGMDALPKTVCRQLAILPEDPGFVVQVNTEGGKGRAWLQGPRFAERKQVTKWTEEVVTGRGHALEFALGEDGAATFTCRGNPVKVPLIDARGGKSRTCPVGRSRTRTGS